MVEKKHVTIAVPEHEYLNPTSEKPIYPSITFPTETPSQPTRIFFISGLILCSLYIIIPILQLYISQRYANSCPLDHHIPHYLFVAGVIGIIVAIIDIIRILLAGKISTDTGDEPRSLPHYAGLCCVSCVSLILNLFLCIWFIFGCYWIFRAKKIVEFNNKDDKHYCHPVLYKFAFWILLFVVIFETVKCCYSFRQTPRDIKKFKKVKTPITTREPSTI